MHTTLKHDSEEELLWQRLKARQSRKTTWTPLQEEETSRQQGVEDWYKEELRISVQAELGANDKVGEDAQMHAAEHAGTPYVDVGTPYHRYFEATSSDAKVAPDMLFTGTAHDAGMTAVPKSVHSKLQAELLEFRSSLDGKHASLIGKFADVTRRVDMLTVAFEKEHEFRLAMETKLDNVHDQMRIDLEARGISDISKKLADATQRIDIVEQSMQRKHELLEKKLNGIGANMEAVHREAHAALSLELAEVRLNMESVHQEAHAALRLELAEAQLLGDLQRTAGKQSRNQEHQNAEALSSGLENISESVHSKLRLELIELRSGIDRKHGSLINDLADMTQRVDTLNDTMMDREHKLRTAMEHKVETKSEELRTDLQMSFQEAHSAIRNKMATMDMEHHAKHAQNAERLEAIIQDTMQAHNANLQEELRLLRSSQTASTSDLTKVMGDVAQQFDMLDQIMRKEHEQRRTVEMRIENLSSEQGRVVLELQEELRTKLREAHAALKSELVEHGRSSTDIEFAIDEACRVLRNEHGSVARDIAERFDLFEQAHNSGVVELERQLRSEFMKNTIDIESCNRNLEEVAAQHSLNHDTLGQRISRFESFLSEKHEETYRELQGYRTKIQIHDTSVDERMTALERQLKMQSESYHSLHGQVNGETRIREEVYALLENRLTKMEAYNSEIANKYAKNVENARSALQEAMIKLDGQRSEHEQYTAIVAERLRHLDKILDQADANSQAFSNFQNKHGQDLSHVNGLLQTERASREAQQQTFFDSIIDAKHRMDELKATVHEQMWSVQQLKEAAAGNRAESTNIIMQERAFREHVERILERRLEVFELAMQAERNERLQAMVELRDAFDAHHHEMMPDTRHTAHAREPTAAVREVSPEASPIVRQVSAPSMSPVARMLPRGAMLSSPGTTMSSKSIPMSPARRQEMVELRDAFNGHHHEVVPETTHSACAREPPVVVREVSREASPFVRQVSAPNMSLVMRKMPRVAIMSSPRATMSPRSIPMSPNSPRMKVAPPKIEHGPFSPAVEMNATLGKTGSRTPRTPRAPVTPQSYKLAHDVVPK